MEIAQAQQDVRTVYRGSGAGALVSAVVWAIAAAIGQWVDMDLAVVVLFVGGALIFPIGSLVLRLLGGPAALPSGHPMIGLVFEPQGVTTAAWITAGLELAVSPLLFRRGR